MCALNEKGDGAQGALGGDLDHGYHTLSLALLHEASLLGYKIKRCSGTSLVVQWLGLHASTAGGSFPTSFNPWSGN